MISFKEALKLGGEDIKSLKADLKKRIEETKNINAYIVTGKQIGRAHV